MFKWLAKLWLARNGVVALAETVRLAVEDKSVSADESREITKELIDLLVELGLLK